MATRFIAPVFDGGQGVTPADGLQLFFFESGTSTPKDTFTTSAATIANSNPVVSDSKGVFPDIWISGVYKVQLKDKNGVQVGFGETDPVSSSEGVSVTTTNFAEPQTLASGQTSVVFSNGVSGNAFYIIGPDADNGRLKETTDYTLDAATKTVTLTQSYPVGTVLLMEFLENVGTPVVDATYDTKAQLSAASIADGELVATSGRDDAGDNGGEFYVIKAPADYNGTPNSDRDPTLANGNIAERKTFGAARRRRLVEVINSASRNNIVVYAHRCGMGYAPENTIAAAVNAIRLGWKIVEFDVGVSSDRVPVCMHDDTVDRTTNGTGATSSLSLAALQALDAGSSFSSSFAGEPVPTAAAMIDAIIHAGGIPLIEIKKNNLTDAELTTLSAFNISTYPSNLHLYFLRTTAHVAAVRAGNPDANIIYYPDVNEPSASNADYVQAQGNMSLHLDTEYVTSFDFTGYDFMLTGLNKPFTNSIQEASLRGFSAMGSDYYVETTR